MEILRKDFKTNLDKLTEAIKEINQKIVLQC